MSHNYCSCGPISSSRGLKQLMLHSAAYLGKDREPTNIKEARHPDIEEMLDCWADCRTAVKGAKAVRKDATERGWLELPEHMSWLANNGTKRQKEAAEKASIAYVERADYDAAMRRGRDIIVGSVMRKDISLEGVAEGVDSQAGRITEGDLDRADEKGRTLKDFGMFLLNEKATTRYTAIYTHIKNNVPKWKVYTAENIWNPLFVGGRLVHIVFREHEPVDSGNVFERHKTREIFRELSLEQLSEGDVGRVIERIWRPVEGKTDEYTVSDDQIIKVRDSNLTEIPVVIDGGPLPDEPMLQAICEKSKKLFGISAKIEYRLHKIAHPTPHLNYEDTPDKSFIVQGSRAPITVNGSNADEVKAAIEKAGMNKAALVPGTLFQTQKASYQYVYDDGTGIDHLFKSQEECKKDLESLGANYGITTNNSNIAEGTERLRQGKDTAFIIAHIASSSEALTQAARWLAVFGGVTNDQSIRDINLDFNMCLNDEGPSYTLKDCVELLKEGALPRIIIIRMIRGLLPTSIIPDDMTDEEILDLIEREEAGALFGADDVEDEPESGEEE